MTILKIINRVDVMNGPFGVFRIHQYEDGTFLAKYGSLELVGTDYEIVKNEFAELMVSESLTILGKHATS